MVEQRTIEARTHGRYLVEVPAAAGPYPVLVGFHGYGENAARQLERMRAIPGASEWMLVAVQGLHRFYNSKTQEVVASWMTREDRELAIADNVAYVDAVVEEVLRSANAPALACVGFSQGVAMAFRAALLGCRSYDAVVAFGGDIPPELRAGRRRPFPPVLIGRGQDDPWYTSDKLREDMTFLERIGARAQSAVHPGGHEWSEPFGAAAGEFLRAIAARP